MTDPPRSRRRRPFRPASPRRPGAKGRSAAHRSGRRRRPERLLRPGRHDGQRRERPRRRPGDGGGTAPADREARSAGALVVFVRNVYTTEANRYLSDVWLEQAARQRKGSYTVSRRLRTGIVGRRLLRRRRDRCRTSRSSRSIASAPSTTPTSRRCSARARSGRWCSRESRVTSAWRRRRGRRSSATTTSSSSRTARPRTASPSHESTLRVIDQFFGQVASVDEVIACWHAPASRRRRFSRLPH